MIADDHRSILRLLDTGAAEGVEGVLVTLAGIEGASSRGIGTQMAVLADGRHAGSFSGGCIEAAVIAEAREALAAGTGRTVRYGVGSPDLDIRLPCGGGIDLVFTPRPTRTSRPRFSPGWSSADPPRCASAKQASRAMRSPARPPTCATYAPPLRLVAMGHGEDLTALMRLARASASPSKPMRQKPTAMPLAEPGVIAMASRTMLPALTGDAWTAFVFLFHDHDWEEHLLPHALAQEGFYHGAVGSARTHRARLDRLRAAGMAQARLDAASRRHRPDSRHPRPGHTRGLNSWRTGAGLSGLRGHARLDWPRPTGRECPHRPLRKTLRRALRDWRWCSSRAAGNALRRCRS